MNLVTIIIPIYKVDRYLRECVESVLHQTYQNLQIILVDDGSPDTSGLLCDLSATKDDRVIVVHGQNGGLSEARNRGLCISSGKYILFVDSDDYLERDAVEILVSKAEKDDLDILLYDAISFDETNIERSPEEEITKYIRQKSYPDLYSGSELFLEMLKNDEYRSPVQYYFYRKSLLDQAELTFHAGVLHEDEEFNFFALLSAHRVKHIPNMLYHHRFRADSIMSAKICQRNTDSLFDIIDTCVSKRELFLKNVATQTAYQVGVARLIGNFFCYVKLSSDRDSPNTQKQIRLLKKTFRKLQYFHDRKIRNAIRYGLRKPITIKSIKMKLYPLIPKWIKKMRMGHLKD